MKFRFILFTAIVVVAATVGMTGCQSKPIDELKMTKAAMDQARSAEAQEYEPLGWDLARMQWEEANSLIKMGQYGEARDVLVQAIGNFNTTRDKAKRRVESLKIEIKALQSSAELELKKLERDSEEARIKLSARRRIEAALSRVDENISTMNADFDAKEYLRARLAGQEALRYAQEIQNRLVPAELFNKGAIHGS